MSNRPISLRINKHFVERDKPIAWAWVYWSQDPAGSLPMGLSRLLHHHYGMVGGRS